MTTKCFSLSSSRHGAILQYLASEGLSESAAIFATESGISVEDSKKENGVLEKKWTSIIRLQKKVMDLEQTVSTLKEELEVAGSGGRRKKDDGSLAIPRPPAKHTLSGHRATVTSVAIHPVYSQVASSSEDASIKLWDYESGEYERSLKGHTGFFVFCFFFLFFVFFFLFFVLFLFFVFCLLFSLSLSLSLLSLLSFST